MTVNRLGNPAQNVVYLERDGQRWLFLYDDESHQELLRTLRMLQPWTKGTDLADP